MTQLSNIATPLDSALSLSEMFSIEDTMQGISAANASNLDTYHALCGAVVASSRNIGIQKHSEESKQQWNIETNDLTRLKSRIEQPILDCVKTTTDCRRPRRPRRRISNQSSPTSMIVWRPISLEEKNAGTDKNEGFINQELRRLLRNRGSKLADSCGVGTKRGYTPSLAHYDKNYKCNI